ncbi:carbohydrate-binding module family 48 protein [Pisolithus microcarpus 441]|uniref:Carbohydrate-binding module family 48 protein n=1 Tax=Pisolithus microcarpus 441 TaxID=765257 RepID=A0A0C9ZNK5_9AGAM|nr:carbohydrate-binding module family 48 protein [Pisolithus microcarpus 441]
MGNTASSHGNQSRPSPVPGRRIDSPADRHSPSPNPHQPHRSLRTKKKSLELPDLALLSLTSPVPGNASPLSHHRRVPRATSPIPIPIPVSNNGTMNNADNTGTSPRGRQPLVRPNVPRDLDSANCSAELLFDQPPSTHIPVNHYHRRPRDGHYFRGAHLQYNSTHSFASRGQPTAHQPRMQELYVESQVPASPQPDQQEEFVQETVHSTLPLVLPKAEEEMLATNANSLDENGQCIHNRPTRPPDESKEPICVKITWRGGGKSVALARAGDNNWKGRQFMEPDDPPADTTWSTWVSLMPGTHHIRFIVDDQWRISDDLPTAVDDEAPALPRHLDKLILNTKVGQPPVTRGRDREREKEREKEREREHRRKQGRSLLGMTSTLARDLHKEDKESEKPPIPITTASGTDVTTVHLSSPSQHTRVGLDGPGMTDDASVLPVPSHVVLHHLSTSAIRNGVLAVGSTTRYRQKYLTTIYYKPT